MGNDKINTYAWQRLRKTIIARDGGQCVKCGSTEQLQVDHIQPRALGGENTPDNLRTLCRRCNRARPVPRPNKAPRTAPIAQTPPTGADSPFYGDHPDPAPTRGAVPPGVPSPEPAAKPRVRKGLIMPRIESPKRRHAGHYGDDVAAVAQTYLGFTMSKWQYYAACRATEYDKNGDFIWSNVVLTIARGQGKSWWLQAMALWRLLRSELFGQTQEIVSVAQKLEVARLVWNSTAVRLEDLGLVKTVRRAAGQECINMPDGATWRVLAASLSSTTGYRAGLVVVDEAWSVPRDVVESGLIPQQARRHNPQLYICSTAGDGSSDLLTTFRDRARKPRSSTLLLEWSAPPGADAESMDSLRFANPDGQFTGKAKRRWRDLWEMTEETKFRTQYLNQWVISRDPWIPPALWREQVSDLEPTAQGVCAVDTAQTGEQYAAVWVSAHGDTLVVRSVRDDKPRRVWDWVQQLPEGTRVYLGVGIDGLQPLDTTVTGRFGGREVKQYLPGVRRLLIDRKLVHDGSETLTEHVLRAQMAQTQSGPVFRMSEAPIDMARDMVVAAGIAQRYRAPILVT